MDAFLEIKAHLEQFTPLSEKAWTAFCQEAKLTEYGQGQVLFEAGEQVRFITFIARGIVRLYYRNGDGKEFNKTFLQPGDALLPVSIMASDLTPRYAAQVLSKTLAVRVPVGAFRQLVGTFEAWRTIYLYSLEKLALRKEIREASFVLDSPEMRYENFLNEFESLSGVISNHHVASYLGISEEALSEIREALIAR